MGLRHYMMYGTFLHQCCKIFTDDQRLKPTYLSKSPKNVIPYPVNIRKIRISQLMLQPLLYFVIIQNTIREREKEREKMKSMNTY